MGCKDLGKEGLEAQLSLDVSDIPEEVLADIFLSAPISLFSWIIHVALIANIFSLFVHPDQQEEEGSQKMKMKSTRMGMADKNSRSRIERISTRKILKMYNEKSARQCFKARPDILPPRASSRERTRTSLPATRSQNSAARAGRMAALQTVRGSRSST